MNTALVTTGKIPLTIGSVEKFQLAADLNHLPWDLTGGTVTISIADPNGNVNTYPATIGGLAGIGAYYQWTVVGPAGTWVRAWTMIDALGRKQVSQPISFQVISSPI